MGWFILGLFVLIMGLSVLHDRCLRPVFEHRSQSANYRWIISFWVLGILLLFVAGIWVSIQIVVLPLGFNGSLYLFFGGSAILLLLWLYNRPVKSWKTKVRQATKLTEGVLTATYDYYLRAITMVFVLGFLSGQVLGQVLGGGQNMPF